MIRVAWVQLVGGLYLLYLPYQHFWGHEAAAADVAPSSRRGRGSA